MMVQNNTILDANLDVRRPHTCGVGHKREGSHLPPESDLYRNEHSVVILSVRNEYTHVLQQDREFDQEVGDRVKDGEQVGPLKRESAAIHVASQ